MDIHAHGHPPTHGSSHACGHPCLQRPTMHMGAHAHEHPCSQRLTRTNGHPPTGAPMHMAATPPAHTCTLTPMCATPTHMDAQRCPHMWVLHAQRHARRHPCTCVCMHTHDAHPHGCPPTHDTTSWPGLASTPRDGQPVSLPRSPGVARATLGCWGWVLLDMVAPCVAPHSSPRPGHHLGGGQSGPGL